MRFRVLACDYDNTLAAHGVVSDTAISALRAVSASGRRLVLVTGRVLEEVIDVFSEITVFDRVVAENGAVLFEPAAGGQRLLGPPVPSSLIAELRRAQVHPLIVGRAMCATLEECDTEVLDALHRLGLDWRVIYNKDSIMVLPPGVDKASGLLTALDDIGETPAATVAVGDAENDIDLLRASGLGVAVANALDSLKEQADLVLDRANGEGVRLVCEALVHSDLEELLLRGTDGTNAGRSDLEQGPAPARSS